MALACVKLPLVVLCSESAKLNQSLGLSFVSALRWFPSLTQSRTPQT